jgi:hypothetical protein
MAVLGAAAWLAQAQNGPNGKAPAELQAVASSNDEWVQFPPRPAPAAPKVQNDKPKAARSTATAPSADDGWIKFPPLPPPKPAPASKSDDLTPLQPANAPTQAVTNDGFVFKAFKFEGNKVYSSKRLEQLLKKIFPKCKTWPICKKPQIPWPSFTKTRVSWRVLTCCPRPDRRRGADHHHRGQVRRCQLGNA